MKDFQKELSKLRDKVIVEIAKILKKNGGEFIYPDDDSTSVIYYENDSLLPFKISDNLILLKNDFGTITELSFFELGLDDLIGIYEELYRITK